MLLVGVICEYCENYREISLTVLNRNHHGLGSHQGGVRRHQQKPRHRPGQAQGEAVPSAEGVELQTKVREDFTITEKDPTRTFSLRLWPPRPNSRLLSVGVVSEM